MERAEFEQAIFLDPGYQFRRAIIIETLANAPSWKEWNKKGSKVDVPYFPNDIIFACLYQSFKKEPTTDRGLAMSFFLMLRNESEAGYLIDPSHKDSAFRKMAKITNANNMKSWRGGQRGSIADFLAGVYFEMWLDGGSLLEWSKIGHSFSRMVKEMNMNIRAINANESKMKYYNSLKEKYCGRSKMGNGAFANLFDADQVGFDLSVNRSRSGSGSPPELRFAPLID